jgi:Xaa-Pro aminopeptidase
MTTSATESSWIPELAERRKEVRAIAARAGCDAALVFGSPQHAQAFRYLTNFAPVLGDAWLVLGATDRSVLQFTWQLDEARARSGFDGWDGAFDPHDLVLDALRDTGATRVAAIGLHRLPVPTHRVLREGLPGLELVDVEAEVAALRRRKSPREIAALREAGGLTDVMLDALRADARPGVTETELAARAAMVALAGGGDLSFETTVIAGVDDPIPIRRPTARALRAGDSVMVDLGAEVDGYQADASRTFVLGVPSAEQRRAWDVVRRAYDAVLALARPGVPCRELHRAGARIIEDAGYHVAHRIGHGIGLATSFEWPSLDSEQAPLEPGVTICIEPGVYAPGAGNMKLEDDLLITEDGCELLTRCDATLEVLA